MYSVERKGAKTVKKISVAAAIASLFFLSACQYKEPLVDPQRLEQVAKEVGLGETSSIYDDTPSPVLEELEQVEGSWEEKLQSIQTVEEAEQYREAIQQADDISEQMKEQLSKRALEKAKQKGT